MTNTTNAPWFLGTTPDGDQALQSGEIDDYGLSDFTIIREADTFSFDWMTSTEEDCDFL